MMAEIPEFRPHLLLRGGHAQTLGAYWFAGRPLVERAVQRRVELADGDQIVLHDDAPEQWTAGGRAALLIHGLAGCHASPYMRKIAAKLNARGVRTFRMDLRGCGAGLALARYPYHSGRSDDAREAIRAIEKLCPGSPVALLGYSLGGNIALKLLGEAAEDVPASVDRAAAVCPPIHLADCVAALGRGVNRLYDRYFTRLLLNQVAVRRRAVASAVIPDGFLSAAAPSSVWEFDDAFTAPVSGFGTAVNYYRLCSAQQFLPAIRVPTLILAAADDPLVPGAVFVGLTLSASVRVQLTRHGGHLGFLGRANGDADRRWMDWRLVDWILK